MHILLTLTEVLAHLQPTISSVVMALRFHLPNRQKPDIHLHIGTRSGSSTHYTAGQSNVQGLPDANTTFTANYTANKYVITYKANGGSGANQTQTCTYGQNFTAKGAIFTRTGYTLDYWTTPAGSWALNGTNVYGWAQMWNFSHIGKPIHIP